MRRIRIKICQISDNDYQDAIKAAIKAAIKLSQYPNFWKRKAKIIKNKIVPKMASIYMPAIIEFEFEQGCMSILGLDKNGDAVLVNGGFCHWVI